MTKSIRIFLASLALLFLVLFFVVGVISVNYTASLYLLGGFAFTLIDEFCSRNTKTRRNLVKIQRFLRRIAALVIVVLALAPTVHNFCKNTVDLDLNWFHSQLSRLNLNLDVSAIQNIVAWLELCSQNIGNFAFIVLIYWINSEVVKRYFFIRHVQKNTIYRSTYLASTLLVGSFLFLGIILILTKIITILIAILPPLGYFSPPPMNPGPPDNTILKNYQVSIIPLDPNMEKFRIDSEVKITPKKSKSPKILRFELDSTIVSSKSIGMFLRELEVSIPQEPLEFDNLDKDAEHPAGKLSQLDSKLVVNLYNHDGYSKKVMLADFPKGSFYQARNPNTLKGTTYLDTETYEWTSLEKEIKFSYIRPPFYGFSKTIGFFLWFASADRGFVFIVGCIGAFIIFYIININKRDLKGMSKNQGGNIEFHNSSFTRAISF